MQIADVIDIQLTRHSAEAVEKDGLRTQAQALRACADSAERAGKLLGALQGLYEAGLLADWDHPAASKRKQAAMRAAKEVIGR